MIDIEKIKRYAAEIRENTRLIKEYTTSEKDFFSDKRNILSVKHLLLQSIESTAIICNHLLSKMGKIAPSGYTECFKGLEEIGAFGREATEKFVRMARFRNILIHHYLKVDDKEVFKYTKENLTDFEDFLEGIFNFLKKKKLL